MADKEKDEESWKATKETLSFEDYKKSVRIMISKGRTTQGADKLMEKYDPDMQEFYDIGWTVATAAAAMEFGY